MHVSLLLGTAYNPIQVLNRASNPVTCAWFPFPSPSGRSSEQAAGAQRAPASQRALPQPVITTGEGLNNERDRRSG
jgi:hypothetical protein